MVDGAEMRRDGRRRERWQGGPAGGSRYYAARFWRVDRHKRYRRERRRSGWQFCRRKQTGRRLLDRAKRRSAPQAACPGTPILGSVSARSRPSDEDAAADMRARRAVASGDCIRELPLPNRRHAPSSLATGCFAPVVMGFRTTSSRRTTLSVSRRVASAPTGACADAGQSVDR